MTQRAAEHFVESMRRYIGERLDGLRHEETALSYLYGAISSFDAIDSLDELGESEELEEPSTVDELLSGKWMLADTYDATGYERYLDRYFGGDAA